MTLFISKKIRLQVFLILPIFLFANINAFAIVDNDGDGLVDIYNLEHLNAIRYNIAGTGLTVVADGITDSDGCFGDNTGATPCNGYELMNNLDFDTNNDGLINANDDYWNAGEGWLPIGDTSSRFNVEFNGNYYEIKNLYIDRDSVWLGLFSITKSSSLIHNLRLTGSLRYVKGGSGSLYAGMLVGINNGTISNVYAHANVETASDYVGGLVGLNDGPISQSYTSGQVQGASRVGGLAGRLRSNSANTSSITDSYTTTDVTGSSFLGGLGGDSETPFDSSFIINNTFATGTVTITSSSTTEGGLFGQLRTPGTITSSHWDLNTTTLAVDVGQLLGTSNAIGLTTVEMQCPTAPDDTSCKSGSTLYDGWDTAIWEFNSSNEYPTLWAFGDLDSDSILNGADKDNDNDLMADAWETNYGLDPLNASDATLDADNDGITNVDEYLQGTNPTIANAPNQTNTGITRAELAKPLLLARNGLDYIPPIASGSLYTDVQTGDFNADWMEQLSNVGISNGCDVNLYCPDMLVTKDQLASLILKAKEGAAYLPPAASGLVFDDVSTSTFAADWIEELSNQGITTGCDATNFCPNEAVTQEGFETMLNLAFP